MSSKRVVIIGGGAAGFFAAIAAAEQGAEVTVLEKTPRFLEKVRISGGGRCNVTHACWDPREFATRYPRGGRALLGPFLKFSARDTVAWFEARGVRLKTEADGRMFPVTNSSETIIDCLLDAAQKAGVRLRLKCTVESVIKLAEGGFEVGLLSERIHCDKVLLATGGCRGAAGGQLAVSLGHTLESPVPSLFTFQIESPWLRSLAGVSADAEVSVPAAKLRERGPLLVTHWGLSGPAVLKISAWGARVLRELNYQFPLLVNWLPESNTDKIVREFQARRESAGAKLIVNVPLTPLSARLVGATRPGGRDCARNPLVGAAADPVARAGAATPAHGIRRDRQEPEQGRVRDLRRREAGRGEFPDDGKQAVPGTLFCGGTAGH